MVPLILALPVSAATRKGDLQMHTAADQDLYPASLPRLGNTQWRAEYDKIYTEQFGTRRLAMVRGEGARLWDAEGNVYLDFVTGISVCNLGHCHPAITRAIQEQAATLVHCSNHYYIPVQIELAKILVESCFADRVVFANSGAEANEAAIKLARRWLNENRGPGHNGIITMKGSFHGRTMATLTATGQEKTQKHFEPLLEGFRYATYNDLASVEALIDDSVGAVMVEPVLGEGGVLAARPEFMQGLRRLCDERGLILILDEVQTGLGRTGRLYAHEHYGITPDVMTIAKSLGGGLAMGAMLCREKFAPAFAAGAHGSTMAGNALTAAAALAYMKELLGGDWSAKAAETGDYLAHKLARATEASPNVRELRALGMMIGLELLEGAAEIQKACEADGLLINVTAGQTLRFLPPLNATREEVDEAVTIVARAIRAFDQKKKQ
jgi:predicted acetylornithine/succinylornithine family transaminase